MVTVPATCDVSARRATFRKLHESGCFVIPNPWDAGTAKFLQSVGFKALASTSAGFGFSHGLPDTPLALNRDLVLQHLRELVLAVDLPVNADFQAGYADTAEGVAESVRLCVDAGVAGFSIEDATGDASRPLYDLPEALDRLAAARSAISGSGVLLTARAECFLTGHADPLKESIRRLQAYAKAGADVLFAPGPKDPSDIKAIIDSVSPKPVNVIVTANSGLRISDLAALGARRISVGSALSRVAWGAFMRAAREIYEDGSFGGFDGAAPFAEINGLFS